MSASVRLSKPGRVRPSSVFRRPLFGLVVHRIKPCQPSVDRANPSSLSSLRPCISSPFKILNLVPRYIPSWAPGSNSGVFRVANSLGHLIGVPQLADRALNSTLAHRAAPRHAGRRNEEFTFPSLPSIFPSSPRSPSTLVYFSKCSRETLNTSSRVNF